MKDEKGEKPRISRMSMDKARPGRNFALFVRFVAIYPIRVAKELSLRLSGIFFFQILFLSILPLNKNCHQPYQRDSGN